MGGFDITNIGNVGIGISTPDEILHLSSSVSAKPVLKIENTNADALSGILEFKKTDTGDAADDDLLGRIEGRGSLNVPGEKQFTTIDFISSDITNADVGGEIRFNVQMDNNLRNFLTLNGYNGSVNQGEIVFNEDSQDVDFRIESSGVVNAFLVQGSSGALQFANYASGFLQVDGSGNLTTSTVDFGDDTNATGGRSITLNADAIDADAALYTDTKCLWFESPTAVDDFKSIWYSTIAVTFTEVWAESDQTVTFNLQEDDGSPANILSASLAPAAAATSTISFADASFAAGSRLDLVVDSVSGTPTWVSICFTATKDD